jgi:GGDEF domain-containing protein
MQYPKIERAERYGLPLSLLLIDLDGLKRVNDLAKRASSATGSTRRCVVPSDH